MITRIFAAVTAFIGLLVFLILFFGSWATVEAGHRGVVIRMGAVQPIVLAEGFNWKRPWTDAIVDVDIRTLLAKTDAAAASKDMQMVQTEIALNLSVMPEKAAVIYQTIGTDYMAKVVSPAVMESVKSEVAKYTAEELLTKRDMVREGISALLVKKLTPLGFNVESVNVVNFDFSKGFNTAIESKVTAEQNALAAKNLLAQKEFEAQQAVATARGKAESMEIEAKAMAENPQILQLRALERWDGVLPKVTGGAVPFIDVNTITSPKK